MDALSAGWPLMPIDSDELHNPLTAWVHTFTYRDTKDTGNIISEITSAYTEYTTEKGSIEMPSSECVGCCDRYTTEFNYRNTTYYINDTEIQLLINYRFTIRQRPSRVYLANASKLADILDALDVSDKALDYVENVLTGADLVDELVNGEYSITKTIENIDSQEVVRKRNRREERRTLEGFDVSVEKCIKCSDDY